MVVFPWWITTLSIFSCTYWPPLPRHVLLGREMTAVVPRLYTWTVKDGAGIVSEAEGSAQMWAYILHSFWGFQPRPVTACPYASVSLSTKEALCILFYWIIMSAEREGGGEKALSTLTACGSIRWTSFLYPHNKHYLSIHHDGALAWVLRSQWWAQQTEKFLPSWSFWAL